MKNIFIIINFFLYIALVPLLAKDELTLVLKITSTSGIPIQNCKVIIIEPNKVGYTNSRGVVKFNLPRVNKVKASIEKLFFLPLDTTFSIDTSVEVATFNVAIVEKEFHSKEVVVTATRTEKELLSISIPMSTYIYEDFKLVEAKKLDELLLELTDIPLVDDHGRGVQLQGLDPDYTLLLVNGEPMVNRTGGILDISRLSVGNVARVEIVKGPSSSLYGSNALAGVINLITEEPQNPTEFNLYCKFGSFNSYDIIGELQQQLFEDKFSFTLFAHKFKTDGFKLNPNTVGKTIPSLTNYSLQMESFYNIASRSQVRFSIKTNIENEFNNYLAKSDTIDSRSHVRDVSGYVFYKNTLNDKFNYEFRAYFSTFETRTDDRYWNTNQVYDEYKFRQDLFKTELQTNILLSSSNYLTIGGGLWSEIAKSLRISGEKESNLLFYLYAQDDINLFNKLNIIGSFRIDDHSEYPLEFNPKLSASYKFTENLVARASVGTGFKAPNFEELYLDWTNPMAGYSVFGRTYIIDGIKKLQEQGQIALLLIAPDSLPILEPEKSLSFDFGMNYSTNRLFVKLNFFRN
ncbi:MAG: TonB-dependent receptor plug domain-containing protein, partial [Candidatus Kapaibacteriota bacterium]